MHSRESGGIFKQTHDDVIKDMRTNNVTRTRTPEWTVNSKEIIYLVFVDTRATLNITWLLDELFPCFKYYNCDNSFQLTFSKYSLDPSGVGLI